MALGFRDMTGGLGFVCALVYEDSGLGTRDFQFATMLIVQPQNQLMDLNPYLLDAVSPTTTLNPKLSWDDTRPCCGSQTAKIFDPQNPGSYGGGSYCSLFCSLSYSQQLTFLSKFF